MMRGRSITLRRLIPVLAVLVFAVTDVRAATILDTGMVTYSPTGTQFGRISRDGISSDWATLKSFPGVTGAPTARSFEAFTVNSGSFPFLQITLDDPTASFFDAAYLLSFNPANVSPSFGLDVHYLGDPGSSEPFGNPSYFQIAVAPNSTIVIPINEITPGGGAGQQFSLLVEGFVDTDYNDTVPEPSSFVLLISAVVFVTAFRCRSASVRNL